MQSDERDPTQPAEDVPAVDAAASPSEPAGFESAPVSEPASDSETRGMASESTAETTEEPSAPAKPKKKRTTRKKSSAKRTKAVRSRKAGVVETAVVEDDGDENEVPASTPVIASEGLEDDGSNPLAALMEPAADALPEPASAMPEPVPVLRSESATSAARDESDAFPFLDGGAPEPDSAGDDIVAAAVREALENDGNDEAAAIGSAEAEIDAMANDPMTAESSRGATENDTPAVPGDAPASTGGRFTRLLAVAKGRLPASFQRTAVRSLAACVLAIAAGFGYGAAVRTFFGGKHADLNGESEHAQNAGSHATPRLEETPGASTLTNEGVTTPVPAPAGHEGHAAEDTASASHSSGDSPRAVAAKSSERFEMPALDSSLPRTDHALGIGRQRLSEGDALAARRIATSFLLREDALSAEDRLLVPQAYALLADSLKVEWDRKHPRSKESSEVTSLPAPASVPVEDAPATAAHTEEEATEHSEGEEAAHQGGQR